MAQARRPSADVTVMFDPYRRLTIVYNPQPKDPPVSQEHQDLEPLRLQLETAHLIFEQCRKGMTLSQTDVTIPLIPWIHLSVAMNDLDAYARRNL